MPRIMDPEWAKFLDHLVSEGRHRTTGQTYVNQVRRILREVENPTPERVDMWLQKRPVKQRTPFRCAYRKYIEWLADNEEDMPFDRNGDVLPADVIEALRRCWTKHGEALLTATPNRSKDLEEVLGFDRVFIGEDDMVIPLSREEGDLFLSTWKADKLVPLSKRFVLKVIAVPA